MSVNQSGPANGALQVAAGVIRAADGRVLVARRHQHSHQGGLWEFPGGKIEAGERAVDTLARELAEELGIVIERATPLIRVRHEYSDRHVELHVLEVHAWRGQAFGREGQAVRWVEPRALAQFEFPAANAAIISAAQLAHVCVRIDLSSAAGANGPALLITALRAGVRVVLLQAATAALEAWAPAFALAAEHGAIVMLEGALSPLAGHAGTGVHVETQQLRRLRARPVPPPVLFSAGCALISDLEHAQQLGADFAVFEAARGAQAVAAGTDWQGLSSALCALRIPVFAAGDAEPGDTARARRCGCQGIVLDGTHGSETALTLMIRACDAALAASAHRLGGETPPS